MKKILIVGGGLSGLSSAVFLSEAGYKVELLEASSKIGGRVYSFEYKGKRIDNGQHLLMGCYANTLEYIKLIDAGNLFEFSESFSTMYVNDKGERFELNIPKNFYPFNRLYGFLRFKLLTFNERLAVVKLLLKIKNYNLSKVRGITVAAFLRMNGQSDNLIFSFWENLVVSTMNVSSEVAAAEIFINMMKIIFFTGNSGANIITPKINLAEALIAPAISKINKSGGAVLTLQKVKEIELHNNQVTGVITNKQKYTDFNKVIFALPEYALRKINIKNSDKYFHLPKLSYSPIVTVYVWLGNNNLKNRMYGMLNGKFDWLFNYGNYIALIKSNATELVKMDKKEVIKVVFSELKKYFLILRTIDFKDYIVVKEKSATIVSNLDSIIKRNSFINPFSNLYVIGDWVNTKLPATLETAVQSGSEISKKIIEDT